MVPRHAVPSALPGLRLPILLGIGLFLLASPIQGRQVAACPGVADDAAEAGRAPCTPLQLGLVSATLPADTLLVRADEAWRAGETARAEALYRTALLEDPDNTVALQRVALAWAWSGRIQEGVTLLDRLLELEPENLDARLDRARFLWWQGRNPDALSALDSLAALHPADPRVLEARMRLLGSGASSGASPPSYDELLGVQSTDGARWGGRAEALAPSSGFDRAVSLWDSILGSNPRNMEARLGRARALAYSQRLDEALTEYAQILAEHPGHPEGLREQARTLAWTGRLVEAEAVLRRVVDRTPGDVDARLVLAQVLHWQGRGGMALGEILQAERLAPGRRDVVEQGERIRLPFRPSVRSSVAQESDSDDNRMTTLATSSTVGLGGVWILRGDVYHRWLEQPGLRRRALGGQVGATLHLDPGWTLALGVGRTGTDAPGGPGSTLVSFALGSPPRHPVRLRTGWSRTALDATAGLADRGVVVEGPELSLDWGGPGGWAVTGGGGWNTFEGRERNTRRSASLSASQSLPAGLRLGVAGRVFTFSRELTEGYFSPSRFHLLEGTARWLHEPGRWSLVLEGAGGLQRIREAEAEATLRVSTRLTFRPAPGREFFVGGGGSSAGTQSFASDSDYRYTALLAGLVWTF